MLVSVKIDDERIKVKFDTSIKELRRKSERAAEKSANALRDHIKNHLLNGGVLNDTTGMPRSKRNTSLKPGALRAALRVRTVRRASGLAFSVYFQGDDQLKYVAQKLMQGVSHPWIIIAGMHAQSIVRKRDRRAMLSFFLHKGIFKGTEIKQKAVIHPGLMPRPVLQQGMRDKVDYIRGVFRREFGR